MDSNARHGAGQSSLSTLPSSSRKRERENETPSQRHKREKAAERQRRKRERDRNNNGGVPVGVSESGSISAVVFAQPGEHQHQPQTPEAPPPDLAGEELSPEEIHRREKVRAAARARQQKHRALVKARKMRELGLDMGNEISEVQYRDGQYQQVLSHDVQHNPHGGLLHHEPPFPQGQVLGGQTFASTLLLSFSCAPLLKQHLLTTLSMTNEELASLQPIIAEAWDHWDHQVNSPLVCCIHLPLLCMPASTALRSASCGCSQNVGGWPFIRVLVCLCSNRSAHARWHGLHFLRK